jgi:hypothetical protein
VSQSPTISLSRLTEHEFHEFMRPQLRSFVREHSADLTGWEVDEEKALADLYDLIHGQSTLDWQMSSPPLPELSGPEISAACAAAVVGVTIGAVALVFQAAGVPASVTRAVGTTVVDDAIAASPALATTLEAQVGALVTADGIYAQAKAIFALFGSIGNVVSIGKIISAIKDELSWYQWVLMGVVITAQLTLWFSTGGVAAVAELVLFGAAIAGLVISATNAYSVCNTPLLLTTSSTAPSGDFVSVDSAGKTYAMTEDGSLYMGQDDGSWATTGETVDDFSVVAPSSASPQGQLWVIAQNGEMDGDISIVDIATGAKTATDGQASMISTADDGETWALRADGSAIRWDSNSSAWQSLGSAFDQVAVSSASTQYGLVTSTPTGVGTSIVTNDGSGFSFVAAAPEATDIIQIATNAAGDLICVTADSKVFQYTGDGSDDPWSQVGGDDLLAQFVSIRDASNTWIIGTDGILNPGGPLFVPSVAPGLLGWDTEDVWDETRSTHLYIVNRAAQLLQTSSNPAISSFVSQLVEPYTPQAQAGAFRTGLCQGLYDADFLAPYNDPNWIKQATWKSHFFDQSTGTNYEGETSPTARTNGTSYTQQAQQALRNSDASGAGYALGLALHYFTDLTQPMHAANYTYLSSFPFGYHTDFEGYVMSVQAQIPQPTVTGFAPGAVSDVGALFDATSEHSKQTYFDQIDQAHKYFQWKWKPQQWQSAVTPLLPDILNDAVASAAQLMYLFVLPLTSEELVQLSDSAASS